MERKKRNKYLLPAKFVKRLVKAGQTGMGWTIIRVRTRDGKIYKNVSVYNCERIIAVYGYEELPFDVKDIVSITVTHYEDYPPDFKGFTTFKDRTDVVRQAGVRKGK